MRMCFAAGSAEFKNRCHRFPVRDLGAILNANVRFNWLAISANSGRRSCMHSGAPDDLGIDVMRPGGGGAPSGSGLAPASRLKPAMMSLASLVFANSSAFDGSSSTSVSAASTLNARQIWQRFRR